jgi:hypothetical protein
MLEVSCDAAAAGKEQLVSCAAVLLRMHKQPQFSHMSTEFYPNYNFSWLAFCLFCALSPLVKSLPWIMLLLFVLY